MIPLFYRINSGPSVSIVMEVLTPLERQDFYQCLSNPRNIDYVRRATTYIDRIRAAGKAVLEKEISSETDFVMVYLVRNGISQSYYGLAGANMAFGNLYPVIQDSSQIEGRIEHTWDITSSCIYELMYSPDRTFYFDHNGNRIEDDDPDEYTYSYTWKGSGNGIPNDPNWVDFYSRYPVFRSHDYYENSAADGWMDYKVEMYSDDVEVILDIEKTGSPTGDLTIMTHTTFHYEPVMGYTSDTDDLSQIYGTISSNYISR